MHVQQDTNKTGRMPSVFDAVDLRSIHNKA